jgi:hypothetical protein
VVHIHSNEGNIWWISRTPIQNIRDRVPLMFLIAVGVSLPIESQPNLDGE